MNLEDLYKLAGIQKSDTPAVEPVEVEQPVAEQPMDGREDMKAMIALVSPEQLNQLVGNAPVEEEGFANSGDEYAGEPEEFKGTLGSPADLSLRRYLDANGQPVHVDETKVYEDHKVEDITEAWNAYKAEPVEEAIVDEKDAKPDYIDIDGDGDKKESMKKAADDKKEKEKADESIEEAKIEEEPNEGNEFSGALAQAKKDGKEEFEVDGKTYKVKEEAVEEAEVVEDENISMLKKLAGI